MISYHEAQKKTRDDLTITGINYIINKKEKYKTQNTNLLDLKEAAAWLNSNLTISPN
jgi:hypothetical protein